MKNRFILFLLILNLSLSLNSQVLEGKIVYESNIIIDENVKTSNKSSTDFITEELKRSLNLSFEKKFELLIFDDMSLYEEVENVSLPSFNFFSISEYANLKIFRDFKNNVYKRQTDLFGKPFLIVDSISKLNWTLINEKNIIKGYECFMAKTTFEDIAFDNNIKTFEVIAWYAPSIPIRHGPDEFWGLPGLILEIEFNNIKIKASEITLMTDESYKFKEPNKGKIVSLDEYSLIKKEKLIEIKNMLNQYGIKPSNLFNSN